MKLYTKSGDGGACGLFSGERVPKCHDRVNAFGEIDELNSALGVLCAVLPEESDGLFREIRLIQKDLLDIGAWIATSRHSSALDRLKEIGKDRVEFLESGIDRMGENLPDIEDFILPGGHISAAYAHMARSICRSAERSVVRISGEAVLGNPPIHLRGVIIYLNRLSDYLFTLARYCNQKFGASESFWKK